MTYDPNQPVRPPETALSDEDVIFPVTPMEPARRPNDESRPTKETALAIHIQESERRARPETFQEKDSTDVGRYSRGFLLIPDPVIFLRDVSARARVVTPAIQRARRKGQNPSIDDLATFLRLKDTTVTDAIREAHTAGLLRFDSGRTRKPQHDRYYPRNRYHVEPVAEPNAEAGFVAVELTPALGTSPTHVLLRAAYLREQRLRGAVRLPLGVAARCAGMSDAAEKKAREKWTRLDEFRKVLRGSKVRPPAYVVTSSTHPPAFERFDRGRRATRGLVLATGTTLRAWTTEPEYAALVERSRDHAAAEALDALARSVSGPVDAREAFDALGAIDWHEAAEAAAQADDEIPF